MKKINLSISKVETLPENIIDELVRVREFWKDLEYRLRALPKIPIGEQLGKLPQRNAHKNAVEYVSKGDADLYVGYVIYKESLSKPWNIEEHSFPVKNGRVFEVTDLPRWNRYDTHYIGMKVPEADIENQKYMYKFSTAQYIKSNSPLGHVTVKPKKDQEEMENDGENGFKPIVFGDKVRPFVRRTRYSR